MPEIKTKKTDANVFEFINNFANTEQKKKGQFGTCKNNAGFYGSRT